MRLYMLEVQKRNTNNKDFVFLLLGAKHDDKPAWVEVEGQHCYVVVEVVLVLLLLAGFVPLVVEGVLLVLVVRGLDLLLVLP